MYKAGGQGRIQGDLGGALALGWVGGASSGVTAGGTVQWDREQREGAAIPQVPSSEAFPDLFPVPSSPCWPCPLPATPQPSSSWREFAVLWGPWQQVHTTTEEPSCHRHEPPTFHIKAKRDSPNLRPPQHCLHKSSAYFCIKSSSFQSYSNARNKRLLWLHVMLKDRWRRAQCLCSIQMSDEIIPVIPNWCCICL